jgi:RNA polymerase sigma-70 factor, ECF subfamily
MDPIEQARHRTMVARCQLGDRQALEELFVRHNPRLGYYLRRMLGRDDVDDAQQEVWLTVIRRIGRLRSPEAFTVWLYQIARSKALNRLADRRLSRCLEDGNVPEEVADEPEPEFSASDAARIHEGLEHLSYEQIAEVVRRSTGTVRSRLHYAKRALLEQLEGPP